MIANASTTSNADERRRAEARRYLEQERAFRIHATVAVCSLALMVAVNAIVNLNAGIADEWWAWWSIWAILGWGIGVTVHGLAVRAARHRLASPADDDARVDALLASLDRQRTH